MWRAISFCFHSCNCLLHPVPSAAVAVISHSWLAFSMLCLILQMFVASLYQHCQSWDRSHSVSLTTFSMSLQTFSLAIIHLWCGGISSTGHWRYGTLQLLQWNNEDSFLLFSILLKTITMFHFPLVFNSSVHCTDFFFWVVHGRFLFKLQHLRWPVAINFYYYRYIFFYLFSNWHITFISHDDTQGERVVEMSQ